VRGVATGASDFGGLIGGGGACGRPGGVTAAATGLDGLGGTQGVVAMTGGTLRGFGTGLKCRPVLAGLVALELGGMAGAAKRGHCFTCGNAIGRDVAAGGTVLLAGAVAGIATDVLRKVGMAFDVGGRFGVALLAGLVDGGGLSEGEEQEPGHARFRTRRRVTVLRLVWPERPRESLSSALSIQRTRSTPG